MSYDQEQIERLRGELLDAMNKVPDYVKNGSVQAVRNWMNAREDAGKLLKKRGATTSQYISAINSLK